MGLGGAAVLSYADQIVNETRDAPERTRPREDRHPHEFVRPETEIRYAEVRQMLGRSPDPERLRGSEQLADWAAEQRVVEAETSAHARKEHLASDTLMRRRAATGERARGGMDERRIRNATGFNSDEAMLATSAVAWDHPESVWQRTESERRYSSARAGGASRTRLENVANQAYVTHVGPVEKALGPGWRDHVKGYTRVPGGAEATDFGPDTVVKTTWKMTPQGRWRLDSCFPISQ